MLKNVLMIGVIVCAGLMGFGCDEKGAFEGDCVVHNISELNELAGYTSITGDLIITPDREDNGEGLVPIPTLITDLDALSYLTEIGGSLKITYVSTLTNMDGLENLDSIGGDIVFTRLLSLESIDCFDSITQIPGDLELNNIGHVQSLDTFFHVATIEGSLTVSGTELTGLGLGSLEFVGRDFVIRTNTTLATSLAETLRDQVLAEGGIGGDILIEGNYDDAFNGVPYFGDYEIYRESDMQGLEGVNYITGNLRIMTATYYVPLVGMVEDQSLDSLEGLESLQKIGGELRILNKDNLTSLNGLNSLTQIGGALYISNNETLTSVSDLENLAYVGYDFIISSNESLPASEAYNLRDQVLAQDGIEGTVSINNNLD